MSKVHLSFPLVTAVCRGRVVRVPAGSLVRVVGTELVIPCNVSDYDGPSEQNFDWSFSSSGSSFVELASTWEVGFPAQLYQERLQRGDILLRRTANDAVELHIKNVQPSDQGHYKCSTPSTDATVQGNYEDTVQVKGTAPTRCRIFLCYSAAAKTLSSPLHRSDGVLPGDRRRVDQVTPESPFSFPSVILTHPIVNCGHRGVVTCEPNSEASLPVQSAPGSAPCQPNSSWLSLCLSFLCPAEPSKVRGQEG